MLKKLTIAENILVPSTWIKIETPDVADELQLHFDKWPASARLYNGDVCKANDVTPETQADIDALMEMKGPFFVMVYPEGWEIVAYLIIGAVLVAAIALSAKAIPPAASRNQQSASPNNALSGRTNQIRINGRIPDIYGTVNSTPDMVAVPYTVFTDHIENEYCFMCIGRGEYDFPGTFPRVRDGQTHVQEIDGTSLEVYAPFTSPNREGDIPQISYGAEITRPVISAVRSKSVNGQVLTATNENTDSFNNLVGFEYPGFINAIPGQGTDFTENYAPGGSVYIFTSTVTRLSGIAPGIAGDYLNGAFSVRFNMDGRVQFASVASLGSAPYLIGESGQAFLVISEALVTDGGSGSVQLAGRYYATGSGDTLLLHDAQNVNADFQIIGTEFGLGGWTPYSTVYFEQPFILDFNFTGEYVIEAVTPLQIRLQRPALVNNNWAWLEIMGGSNLNGGDDSFGKDGDTVLMGASSGSNWVGPFTFDVPTMTEIIANVVAVQGMYRDNGEEQSSTFVDVQFGATPVDIDGNETGAEEFFTVRVEGSDDKQDQRAATLFGALATVSRYKVRARRVTPKDIAFDGRVVDEVKWRDLYASSPVAQEDFGDCTTVHCLTQATTQALAVSERQINMLVTRKIPLWLGGETFSALTPTNDAAEIFCRIAIDAKLGRRSIAEVNFQQIFDTLQEIKDYFGTDEASEFSYTFDNDNMSPEEMLSVVASAVFCTANRRGNVLEWKFEKKTDDSVLLFNHRNKIPRTENRTNTFGNVDNNDGIEYEYVSPIDDAVVTIYIPEDRSSVKPRKIESVGVRLESQAFLHAYREYNRLLYQSRSVEFEAMQEADILSINDRVLVADNTRPDTQDGDIEDQNGLFLTLSQPCVFKEGASYLIFLQYPSGIIEPIDVTYVDDYTVLLGSLPSEPLSYDGALAVRSTYVLVEAKNEKRNAFLITEKDYPNAGNFRATLRAINYDERYYQNDLDYAA